MRRALFALFLAACSAREIPPREPVFADVAPLLMRECAECHGGEAPAAGWRVDGYVNVVACPIGAGSAVEPPDQGAPILRALERDDHRGLFDDRETALVRAWVAAGAPARVGAAHPGGFVDPRSAEFHGRALREARWAPILDASDPFPCARCHESSSEPRDAGTAPGASACTSCHSDEGGVFACSTCHGAQGRAYPPRDLCFHADEAPSAGAHRAHAEHNIDCAVCHGERDIDGLARSEHGDGAVQVILEAWDAPTRTCASSCHARGGAGPSAPSWDAEITLECGSCHASPPADHYPGPCSACHDEAADDGASLRAGPLHANGTVDLGDGTGGCGACHGAGDDPWPTSGAHPAHARPAIAAPFDCSECHRVPLDVLAPGHLDDTLGAEVTFGALASARGASPQYDGGCREVACHGAGLGGGTRTDPPWRAGDLARTCGACHGVPPPAPHTSVVDCGASICHGGAIAPGPSFTEIGRTAHVDGIVQP